MKVKHTQRGFEIIEFKDYNSQECSLQQSSLAIYVQPGTSAIWFGVGNERMHLSDKEVKKLLPHLQQWLEKGTFIIQKPAKEQINNS